MTISGSTVAIIGVGNIGSRLAANFAAGGQGFLLAGRDEEAAQKLASALDGHAEVVSVDMLGSLCRGAEKSTLRWRE